MVSAVRGRRRSSVRRQTAASPRMLGAARAPADRKGSGEGASRAETLRRHDGRARRRKRLLWWKALRGNARRPSELADGGLLKGPDVLEVARLWI
ncbi:uncharacterized protein [Melanerpes formicivorus]|uniref:uncharacterized protein isoform X2 n=1 Tax=Melanerpes formicivorus TaxID=211600 RepID=UPI00358EF310